MKRHRNREVGQGRVGRCALCHRDPIKLCHSHIIPEFNYKACYDAKGRFTRLSAAAHHPLKWLQKGLREYLLCADCEKLFSGWEDKAKRILIDGRLDFEGAAKIGSITLQVDYDPFKLYTNSILWRMSVSKHPMFEMVDLGDHESQLREALLRRDPMGERDYPALLAGVLWNGRFFPDFITAARLAEEDGVEHINLVIGGVHYTFVLCCECGPSDIDAFTLKKDGMQKVAVLELSQIEYLYQDLLADGEKLRDPISVWNRRWKTL